MCHTTSSHRNSCGVTPACCRIPQMLAYTVVHVALVVFVNLLSYCAECRSHLAVAHMVLGTRSVCVCTEPVKAHDIHTWFWVLNGCWATGFTREHMERVCTPADPRVTARPERCVRPRFHHTLSVHATSLPNMHQGSHVNSDIIAALCIASTRLCFAQSSNALSAMSCVQYADPCEKEVYFSILNWIWMQLNVLYYS